MLRNTIEPFNIFGSIFTLLCKKCKEIILNKISKKLIIKPSMIYREIEIIEEILKNLQPQKVLEWGSGYSTLYFPKFVNRNTKWIALEHSKDWFIKIKKLNQNPNVTVIYIPPNHLSYTDTHENGSYSDFKNYIEFPSRFESFDLILIDGRARKDCLIKAHDLIFDKGIVILHDANRKYYHNPFKLYKNQVLFNDYRKFQGGIWIGSNKIDILRLLNVNKYKLLWKIYEKIECSNFFNIFATYFLNHQQYYPY